MVKFYEILNYFKFYPILMDTNYNNNNNINDSKVFTIILIITFLFNISLFIYVIFRVLNRLLNFNISQNKF